MRAWLKPVEHVKRSLEPDFSNRVGFPGPGGNITR